MRLGFALLLACSSPAKPVSPTNVGTPIAPKPGEIAVQLGYRGTFFIGPPFSHLPPFTLLTDGTLIVEQERKLLTTKLPLADVDRIVGRVIALGFEKLESHEEHCQKTGKDTMICTSDGSYSILRVRVPSTGKLKEVVSYEGNSNEPEMQRAIIDYLEHHEHPHVTPYRPVSGAVHVQPQHGPVKSPCPAIDRALLHVNTEQSVWGFRVEGAELDAYLRLVPDGKAFACADGAMYELTLIPGVPGSTHLDDELAVYDRFKKE